MKKLYQKLPILFLTTILLLFGISLKASRIERRVVDVNQVQRVFIIPGKPLLVEFPCAVSFALPGTKSDLEIKVGIKHKNNLTFWAHSMTDVTGINVKCGEHLIVFDVIPHKTKYQSYINISRIKAGSEGEKRRLIAKSKGFKEEIYKNKGKKKLIFDSKSDLKGGKNK